jgi:uncharacterized membrane protein YkoI
MNQRIPLTIAATITAFIITMAGGVAMYVTRQPMSPVTPTATAGADVATAAPAPGLDPTVVDATLSQRDAAYQQRIEQANAQLRQANQQLNEAYRKQQELADQLTQAYQQQKLLADHLKQARQQPPAPIAQPRPALPQPEPTYAISPETAAAIALGAAPGTTLSRVPELVSFQGMVAYDVLLDRGTVYVDATSGQILYNGAAVAVASGGGGGHEDGEHEGGGDD